MAKISMEESEMNISAVEDVFSGFYCEIPVDKYSDEDEIRYRLRLLVSYHYLGLNGIKEKLGFDAK